MAWLLVQFLLLGAAIAMVGTLLTKYADELGEKIGISESLSGMLLLAVATSLPELVTDSAAARIGAIDIAVGDLLGSCLFNLLILAVLDMMFRSRGRMLSRQSAAHALSAQFCILLAAVVMLCVVLDIDWTIGRVGIGTIAIGITFFLGLRMVFFDRQYARMTSNVKSTERLDKTGAARSLKRVVFGYSAAALGIFAIAPFLARSADELAAQSGLGGTFLGTIFVAVATALPEVSTTRAAAKMGAFDLAIGNIFGSNSFNILILLAVDLFYPHSLLSSVDSSHAITSAAVIIVTAIATMGLLYQAERRVWIIEYDAGLMVLLILGSFALLFRLSVP